MVHNPIIVALDGKSMDESLDIAERLKDKVWGFKANDLYALHGLEGIKRLAYRGRVMLDAKWHDIPNTVKNYAKRVTQMGEYYPVIATVHASGGREMISAASEALRGFCQVAAVTCLTSLDADVTEEVFAMSPESMVTRLVEEATEGGAGMVVCSPQELGLSCFNKKHKWAFKGSIITPGIRPEWHQDAADDQKRTMTPAEAMAAGADYLVMGRPILQAENMVEAAEKTLAEINAAMVADEEE
jgi:orotidine-5'-phosphate decarboxylase